MNFLVFEDNIYEAKAWRGREQGNHNKDIGHTGCRSGSCHTVKIMLNMT